MHTPVYYFSRPFDRPIMDSVPILLSNKRIYLGSRGIPYSNRSVLNTLDVHLPNPELSLGDSPRYWIL